MYFYESICVVSYTVTAFSTSSLPPRRHRSLLLIQGPRGLSGSAAGTTRARGGFQTSFRYCNTLTTIRLREIQPISNPLLNPPLFRQIHTQSSLKSSAVR